MELFDRPFFDTEGDKVSSPFSAGGAGATATTSEDANIEALSKQLQQTYLNETEYSIAAQRKALKAEMDNLPSKDKDQIMFHVHGLPMLDQNEQQQGNTDEYLKKLDDELWLLCNGRGGEDSDTDDFGWGFGGDGTAFREAQALNPKYVNDPEFRLRFLRKAGFDDLGTAASNILLHFNVKKALFGNGEVLGREVRLSDLSPDDRDALYKGAFQVFPERDAAGRPIVCYAPQQRKYKTIENWCRAFWYVLMQVASDPETHRAGGCVQVYHPEGFLPTNKRDPFSDVQKSMSVLAAGLGLMTTICAVHYCYNDHAMEPLMTSHKIHCLSKQQRCHFREHYYERHDDLCFKLETFGIPIDRSLFLPGGRLGMSWYMEWIRCHESREREERDKRNKEQLKSQGRGNNAANSGRKDGESASVTGNTPATGIILPRKFDVLFGKGKSREHAGNLRCAYLVEQHQVEYEKANRTGKTHIAQNIIAMIKESGGRFLKKDGNQCWQEVTHTQAREKVAHFFRRLREVQKANVNDTESSSRRQQQNEKRGLMSEPQEKNGDKDDQSRTKQIRRAM